MGAPRTSDEVAPVRKPACSPPARPALLSILIASCSFLGTALLFLVQTDAERVSTTGGWPVLSPWLHTSALPVFAVLSVVVALVYRTVARWFADYSSAVFRRLDGRVKLWVTLNEPWVVSDGGFGPCA